MALIYEYNTLIASRKISDDKGQRSIVSHLQKLQEQLQGYVPASQKKLWFNFRNRKNKSHTVTPRGVYIWGDVGRGKSMLMDLFYRNLPLEKKRRLHFHAFMTEIHGQLHAWRQLHTENAEQGDPIPSIAGEIAAESYVLCLDEFQVTDVADAVILSRLFGELIDLGVVVVTTSNLPPESLYTDGLQREYFLRFVRLAESRWDIMELAGQQDYRLKHLRSMNQVYFTPLGEQADNFMNSAYADITCQADKEKIRMDVGGRIIILHGHGDVCWSNFSELCEQPLGSADYLEIAREFHTVMLSDIPVMPPEMRNEAARFVKLIDALYDHHVKLICSAEAPPDQLYVRGDTAFEFKRTASRLAEMQSEQYFATPHVA